MARLPRLYRVRQVRPDSSIRTRTYLHPEAAAERKARWDEDHPDRPAELTPSYPAVFPHPSGDAQTMPIPDTLVLPEFVDRFILGLGLMPEAVRSITLGPDGLTVEYQADPTGKRQPKVWTVGYL